MQGFPQRNAVENKKGGMVGWNPYFFDNFDYFCANLDKNEKWLPRIPLRFIESKQQLQHIIS